MTTDTSRLITPPSVEEYEALRDSIARSGQQAPILLAPDASIVDGNQRMRACGELSLIPNTITIDVDANDPLAIEACALLHNADTSRTPDPAERARIVLALSERGHAIREIVAMTGLSHGTVQRTVRSTLRVPVVHEAVNGPKPGRFIDRQGRQQAIRKTTPIEIGRRDELIRRLYHQGHSTHEICAAVDIGESVVSGTLRRLGVQRTKRYKGAGEITEPCLWRDEDMPTTTTSRWRQSRPIVMAKMLDDEYAEGNFANVLANQATDAVEAGDRAWVGEALATVEAVLEKLERARLVLTDDAYRRACREAHEGVEVLRARTPLRAV